MKKQLFALMSAVIFSLGLTACGSETVSSEMVSSSKKETVVDVGLGESSINRDDGWEKEDDGWSSDDFQGPWTKTVIAEEPQKEEHCYKSVTVSAVNFHLIINGIDYVMSEFSIDGCCGNYIPSLSIRFDGTGKATDAEAVLYCSAYVDDPDNEYQIDFLGDFIYALKNSEFSNYFSGYSRKVIEYGDENYPLVEALTIKVDVTSSYFANLNQYILTYLVDGKQNIEGLREQIKTAEANGCAVTEGTNYIVDPIGDIRYEWND